MRPDSLPGTTGKAASRAPPPHSTAKSSGIVGVRPKMKAAQPMRVIPPQEIVHGSSYEDYSYSESEEGDAPNHGRSGLLAAAQNPGGSGPVAAAKSSSMADKLRALRAQKEALGQGRADHGLSNGPSAEHKEALPRRRGSRTDATAPKSKARPTRHRADIRLGGASQSPSRQENEGTLKRRWNSPRSMSPYQMRPAMSPPRRGDTYTEVNHRPTRRRRRVDRDGQNYRGNF